MDHKEQITGFTLIEVMISAGLFLVIATAVMGGIAYSYQTREASALRGRAVLMASEGLEAARDIRDNSFASLVNGAYGLNISNGKWIFSGSYDTLSNLTRTVTISTVDANTKQVTSKVSWTGGAFATGSTSATTYLSNLALLYQQANSFSANTSAAYLGGLTFYQLSGITIQNTGPKPITITKVTPSWGALVLVNQLSSISINSGTVWSYTGSAGSPSGLQSSGAVLTIVPTVIPANSGAIPINFVFNGTMILSGYSIVFTLSDGSMKTVTL